MTLDEMSEPVNIVLYASRVAGQHRKRNVRQCQLPVPESDRRSLEKAGPRPFRRSGAPTRPPLRTKSDCSQARVLAMIRVIRGRVRSVWRPPSRPSHHRPLMARLRCGDGPGPARGPSLSRTHPGAGRTALRLSSPPHADAAPADSRRRFRQPDTHPGGSRCPVRTLVGGWNRD